MKSVIRHFAVSALFTLFTPYVMADIAIGLAGPMTGQYAAFGEQFLRGAQMAVDDINAQGGVLGQKLKLEIADDVCDPKQAVAVANQLVNKRVAFVVGHFCSGSSIPASDVYREEGIVQVSPGSTNPQLTERGLKNVFRICGRDDQQGFVAGNYVADHFNNANIAILNDKTSYGKGLAEEMRKQLNARGKKESMFEAYTAGEKDYSALVSRMKAANIGLIFLGGYHTEGGLIVRQAKQQGLNAVLMGGDALFTNEYWAVTGAAGEGTLMTFSPDPSKIPEAQPLVNRFIAMGYKPEGYTLNSYAILQIFQQAVTKLGAVKSEGIMKTLRSEEFNTVIGKIRFDAKGDVQGPGYVVYEWHDGSYDYVK